MVVQWWTPRTTTSTPFILKEDVHIQQAWWIAHLPRQAQPLAHVLSRPTDAAKYLPKQVKPILDALSHPEEAYRHLPKQAKPLFQAFLHPTEARKYLPNQAQPLIDVLARPIDARKYMPTNPHFKPLAGSAPIPYWAAILPPLAYFLALTLLPPFEHSHAITRFSLTILKFSLAAISVFSFAVLPFWYHVPGSAIFTYQLGLIGCFGAGRAFDIFFLSYPRVPRRLASIDVSTPMPSGKLYPNDSINEDWPTKAHPSGIRARLWWALDLMISMRGVGWDFASADLRHDSNPWQSPGREQFKRAFFKVGPLLAVTLLLLRKMTQDIDVHAASLYTPEGVIESAGIMRLPIALRPLFVACTGISLYALFDFGYTVVAATLLPALQRGASLLLVDKADLHMSNAHNVDFFPLLNPLGLTAIRSVRSFWSKAWHRLFHRSFLIYGIIPWRNAALRIEYTLQCLVARIQGRPKPVQPFEKTPFGKPSASRYADPGRALRRGEGDWGKVLGAFFASGVIHGISERAALGGRVALPHLHLLSAKGWRDTQMHLARHNNSGRWTLARLVPPFSGAGEFSFFFLNGLAVIVETAIGRAIMSYRRKRALSHAKKTDSGPVDDASLTQWYDIYIQLAWTLTVLLSTGELFVEGWIASGLIAEITMS